MKGIDSRSKVSSSHRSNGLMLRVGVPLMVGGAFSGLYGDQLRTWRVVFALPFALCAAFFLSLAVVQLRDGKLRYRRLFRWMTINPAEIVASGRVWPPFIGYIRLSRTVAPWGRLYFVLDPKLRSNPFRRGEYAILNYLEQCRGAMPQREAPSRGQNRRPVNHRFWVSAAVGFAVSLMRIYLTVSYGESNTATNASASNLGEAFLQFVNRPAIALVYAIFACMVALRNRDERGGWAFALLAGFLLPGPLVRLFS